MQETTARYKERLTNALNHYFVFDLLICQDRDLTRLPLSERHKLMKSHLKLHSNRIRIAEQFKATANDMPAAVRQQQLDAHSQSILVPIGLDQPFKGGSIEE